MLNMIEQLKHIRIVPVVVLHDPVNAKPLAKALCNGGLPCAEITFRTEAAVESIQIISREFPEMLVGAGTVLTPAQADQAMKAGAKFIVSPGLNPVMVKHCIKKKYPVIPGINNPQHGINPIEIFPRRIFWRT